MNQFIKTKKYKKNIKKKYKEYTIIQLKETPLKKLGFHKKNGDIPSFIKIENIIEIKLKYMIKQFFKFKLDIKKIKFNSDKNQSKEFIFLINNIIEKNKKEDAINIVQK